jgi:hypothetical protein
VQCSRRTATRSGSLVRPCWVCSACGGGPFRGARSSAGGDSIGISPADPERCNDPFLDAVGQDHRDLADRKAKRLRQHLLRGGFLMVSDFHGRLEWARFLALLRRIFPDRPVVEIPDATEVLQSLDDLDRRIRIPDLAALSNGVTW